MMYDIVLLYDTGTGRWYHCWQLLLGNAHVDVTTPLSITWLRKNKTFSQLLSRILVATTHRKYSESTHPLPYSHTCDCDIATITNQTYYFVQWNLLDHLIVKLDRHHLECWFPFTKREQENLLLSIWSILQTISIAYWNICEFQRMMSFRNFFPPPTCRAQFSRTFFNATI